MGRTSKWNESHLAINVIPVIVNVCSSIDVLSTVRLVKTKASSSTRHYAPSTLVSLSLTLNSYSNGYTPSDNRLIPTNVALPIVVWPLPRAAVLHCSSIDRNNLASTSFVGQGKNIV